MKKAIIGPLEFKITIDSFKKADKKLKAHYETEEELQQKIDNNNFHVLRILVWRALIHGRPSLTLEKVGEDLKVILQNETKMKRLKNELNGALLSFSRQVDKANKKIDEALAITRGLK